MELKDVFYKWVPSFLWLPVLFALFFIMLTANGIFAGNTTDMFSSLGVYAEHYIAAYNALFIGMGLGLLVEVRLKLRFSGKTLLVFGLCMMILMNIICATTTNPYIVIVACLLLGIFKISCLTEIFSVWLFKWSKTGDPSRIYPFLYFTSLAGTYCVTWYMARLASNYNWKIAYIWIIILLLLSLLLSLLLIKDHPLHRKVRLYQMDRAGLFLLATSLLLTNYIIVYGKVEDWLESPKIRTALMILPFTFLVFIRRQLVTKHPLINFSRLNRRNLWLGLLYFFIIGIFISPSIQTAFSGTVLHYETIRNMELNLYMIPGLLAGAIICYFWYYFKCSTFIIMITGIVSIISYHVLMYTGFVRGFALQDFWLPSILKGFGIIVLYISGGLFTIATFERDLIMKVVGLMIIVRSFLSGGIFNSLSIYLLYEERVRHFNNLAAKTDIQDQFLNVWSGSGAFNKIIQDESLLSASKQLSGYVIVMGLVFLALLFLYHFTRRYNANTLAGSRES